MEKKVVDVGKTVINILISKVKIVHIFYKSI